jgi:hypothetical protein
MQTTRVVQTRTGPKPLSAKEKKKEKEDITAAEGPERWYVFCTQGGALRIDRAWAVSDGATGQSCAQ